MLIYIPLFYDSVSEEEQRRSAVYCAAAVNSYYRTGNTEPLLICTNMVQIFEVLSRFCAVSGFPFECRFVPATRESILKEVLTPVTEHLADTVFISAHTILFIKKLNITSVPTRYTAGSENVTAALVIPGKLLQKQPELTVYSDSSLLESAAKLLSQQIDFQEQRVSAAVQENSCIFFPDSEPDAVEFSSGEFRIAFTPSALADAAVNYYRDLQDALLLWYQHCGELAKYSVESFNDLSRIPLKTIERTLLERLGIKHYSELSGSGRYLPVKYLDSTPVSEQINRCTSRLYRVFIGESKAARIRFSADADSHYLGKCICGSAEYPLYGGDAEIDFPGESHCLDFEIRAAEEFQYTLSVAGSNDSSAVPQFPEEPYFHAPEYLSQGSELLCSSASAYIPSGKTVWLVNGNVITQAESVSYRFRECGTFTVELRCAEKSFTRTVAVFPNAAFTAFTAELPEIDTLFHFTLPCESVLIIPGAVSFTPISLYVYIESTDTLPLSGSFHWFNDEFPLTGWSAQLELPLPSTAVSAMRGVIRTEHHTKVKISYWYR